jgi:hypothetical protein
MGAYLQIYSAQGSNLWTSSPTFLPGQFVLNQNDSYLNPNGYRITMQSDGNLVTYNGSKVLYATGSSANCGSNGCFAAFQTDGNFVIYNGSSAIWASNTSTTNQAFLSLQYPYIQIDQTVGGACRIVYPQAIACLSNQPIPPTLNGSDLSAALTFSATIGLGGVGYSSIGASSIGASASNSSFGSPGGYVGPALYTKDFPGGGSVFAYDLTTPSIDVLQEYQTPSNAVAAAEAMQDADTQGGTLYIAVRPGTPSKN